MKVNKNLLAFLIIAGLGVGVLVGKVWTTNVSEEAPLAKCVQFGRVLVGGADSRIDLSVVGAIGAVETPCIEFTAVFNGYSAYIVVDTSDGWAPDSNFGFKLKSVKEHNLNRHILCVLNAHNLPEKLYKVNLERVSGTQSVAALVNVGVYPFAENETCAGWRAPAGAGRE